MSDVVSVSMEKASVLLSQRMEHYSALWMPAYRPRVRERDPNLEFYSLGVEYITPENFSPLNPVVIPLYENSASRFNEAMRLDAFTRGAVSVASMIDEYALGEIGSLINMQLQAMEERQDYPSVVEDLVPFYCETLVTILCNEEPSTWRALLSFNSGAWWMLSFVKNRHDKVNDMAASQFVHVTLQGYALKGTFNA